MENVHSEEVFGKLLVRNVIKQMINLQQNRTRPTIVCNGIPHNLFDVEIHHLYNLTICDEPFFKYHSENNDRDRLIIFKTVENIRLFIASDTILSGGTF